MPQDYQVVVVDGGLGRCPRDARRDCYSGVHVVVVVHWGQGIGLQLDGPFPIVPLGSEAGGRVCLGRGRERFGIDGQFG